MTAILWCESQIFILLWLDGAGTQIYIGKLSFPIYHFGATLLGTLLSIQTVLWSFFFHQNIRDINMNDRSKLLSIVVAFSQKHMNKRKNEVPIDWMPDHKSTEPSKIKWTHWVWDKMDPISQMTFSNAFSWMKIHEFRVRFHWNLFLRIELTILQHWFRKWLGAGQATSHYLNQWWLVYWRIYASLGLNELKKTCNSIARPYDEPAFSPFYTNAGWLPYLAINMFLVYFDALAHTYITPGL